MSASAWSCRYQSSWACFKWMLMIWRRVTRTQILRQRLADGRLNSNQSYTSRKVMFLSVTLTEMMGFYIRILRAYRVSLQHNRERRHILPSAGFLSTHCCARLTSTSYLQECVYSIHESGRSHGESCCGMLFLDTSPVATKMAISNPSLHLQT